MMNGRVLTIAQLRTHIAAVRQKVPEERMGVIGLRTSDRWDGPPSVDCEGQDYQVVQAGSVLAVREAVLAAAGREPLTVVLTPLEPLDLGQDLLARMAGGRLYSIDLWESVRGLFKARQIDPTVRGKSIAQALLDHAPTSGYPPVPAGVLDAASVWRTLCRHAFQMSDGELDVPRLLIWAATTPGGVARYGSAPDDLREALRERVLTTLGPAAGSVLAFIEAGHAQDALALSVVCGVVFRGAEVPPELREAAARLERFHGNAPLLPVVGEQLAQATREALRDSAADHAGELVNHLTRADQILREVRAEQYAWLSDLTPLGQEQRLGRFAQGLQDALASARANDGQPAADCVRRCEELVSQLGGHALLQRQAGTLESARMATRLLRWLARPAVAAGDLLAHGNLFRDDHAFADWARDVVSAGDDHPAVSAAYRSLELVVRQRRQAFNRAFAQQLLEVAARSSLPQGVVPVEQFLDTVVAPLAEAGNRLLVIVLDGMSWPVAHELLPGLRRAHWQEMTYMEEGVPPPSLLAALPSVTEVSRTSLLTGQLRRGAADDEKRLFADHPALSAACARRHPPVLLHKAELTEGSRGGLSAQASQVILNADKRVVGVVINAIDDRLAGAQQVRDRWSVEHIKPLGALLQAARDAGRVVVLASDHGHVWHREDSVLRRADGGARWRPASGAAEADEVILEGPRVRTLQDQTRVIVPWEEGVRYGTARNGYHGGATPQEMLAPLVLLAPVSGPSRKGLSSCQLAAPVWWDERPLETRPAPVSEVVKSTPITIPWWCPRSVECGVERAYNDLRRPTGSHRTEGTPWTTTSAASAARTPTAPSTANAVPATSPPAPATASTNAASSTVAPARTASPSARARRSSGPPPRRQGPRRTGPPRRRLRRPPDRTADRHRQGHRRPLRPPRQLPCLQAAGRACTSESLPGGLQRTEPPSRW